VRDISRRLGKKIDYSEKGGETLLDRQIIEKMNEPLIHMIKNSVDHGIESPEEREKNGKNPQGMLRLSAVNDQGKIVITLEDDGNGINGGMVKRKAIEKGIISEEEADKLSEKQAQMLIFSPGFSTRDEATDVSGRGVGMDAVKKAVETLQGALEIESEPGKGTKFIITLPLTMASTTVLFVTVAGVTVAFPTVFMEKVTRISGNSVKTENGRYRLSLANENMPLCFLETVLTDESRFPADKKKIPIIIISIGSRRVAIAMNEITAQKEVVVKPLPSNVQNADFWTGAALSPSGQIAPVLNIQSVISACGVH
jgi:two-component system chemotaxis sensor kinase CheA